MTEFLSADELMQLEGAENAPLPSPIPTQEISNGEFFPGRRSLQQQRVEARIQELGTAFGRRQGLSRRDFLKTASGMAAAFLAMNEIYGPLFLIDSAEAADLEQAQSRADSLAHQFIFDDHTHFLRDDTRLDFFVKLREWAGESGKNPALAKEEQTLEHLKFKNYIKEIWMDSDTTVALLSGAPSDIPRDWFLTNEMKAKTRERINELAGSRRLLSHAVFTPGQPGWLEDLDHVIEELKPDSWKGYTIGDNTHKELSQYPWGMDDEKVAYKGYEKMAAADIRNVCVHKGLFPPSAERQWPRLLEYAKVDDVGKAAQDWPQLNFLIYHAGYRYVGGSPEDALAEFERSGRIAWVSDLAEIPEKYGVDNVYADLGATFASAAVTHPRLCAAIMGILIRGLGVERVVWGTDSIWWGSPQWQIEALRRLEIPEDMRKQHGFQPLGPADGLVKSAILGYNSVRLYQLDLKTMQAATSHDHLASLRAEYRLKGANPSHVAYGYVRKPV